MKRKIIDVKEMDTPERVRVLGIIDQFRELGLNQDISLPQLVVVGDQSSGKSSLLEGLTGLSFPIASDLCTRHATQIVLRRTHQEDATVKISILPGPTAANDEAQKALLEGFAREIAADSFTVEEFQAILEEAAITMGLPGADADIENLEKRFSEDILKIELSGPNHHHLSVVDVPGLFHNPTKYQTEEDKAIIRSLIERYITDTRTIILAVLDARNNLANQEVFRMARAADPSGTRTVGIITKCDALQEGDEPGVLKIAQNSVERLNHGWFAVRNRSTKEILDGVTIEQRHVNERKFFETSPWNKLERDRVGITALKKFLAKLLYDHIRGEYPALVQEIRDHVLACRKELDALGPSRQTATEQRQFMIRLAGKYQQAVTDSLSGNYGSGLEPGDPLKLRMHIQTANESFGRRIELNGHTRPFRLVDGSIDKSYERENDEQDICDWIRTMYRQSRGAELPGTVNPVVLENMFRQQSSSWEIIGKEHVESLRVILEAFNKRLFAKIITEESVRLKMESRNRSFANTAYEAAMNQLDQILQDERGGILQTINHYFAETIDQTREERIVHRLEQMGFRDGGCYTINLVAVSKAAHLGNEDQAVNDIHDILKAYYKVALKRFMDNMIIQVVERHFLGSEGPVKAVSPEYVGLFSDAELSDIAAESYATSSNRVEIGHKLERLQKALSLAENQRL